MTVRTAARDTRDPWSVALFVVSILASAFLIFLVQPMVGKRILPWFGGTAAVWMVCLAFYQTTLFLGYAYAHLLIRFASPTAQLGVHALLVCLALLFQPVLPDDSWSPAADVNPVAEIIRMLAANVAVPFLLLASTGPLVQAWFSRRHPTHSPYPLYAVSNIGSLLALLAFPFLLEPSFGLSEIGRFFSVGFDITVLLVLICAALALRAGAGAKIVLVVEGESTESDESLAVPNVLLWLLLSASGVMLLMGVTNRLCQDVASVPFLWILPLAIYLLTLIVAFGSERFYSRSLFLTLGFLFLLKTIGAPVWEDLFVDSSWYWRFHSSLSAQISSYVGLLFSLGMLMHGELHRMRPPAHALTAFYLFVSGGGALGGLFVGLVAPLVFNDYHELSLSLVLAWLLALIALLHNREVRSNAKRRPYAQAIVCVAALFVVVVGYFASQPEAKSNTKLVHQERTFFGVLRVTELHNTFPQRHLTHGTTLHGVQFIGSSLASIPTSYFGRATPIGLLLDSRPSDRETRVGIVGLGAGTLAAYGRAGDLFRFYEIDPSVIRLASKDGPFEFLEKTPSEIELVEGDARLSLEREAVAGTPQNFDVLVIDAFSGDGIPVHLLTTEAFARYRQALAPDGLIALHLSNRHMDLMPQVARQGREAGFAVLSLWSEIFPRYQSQQTRWTIMSPTDEGIDAVSERINKTMASLKIPAENLRAEIANEYYGQDLRIWTDEQSDVFSLVKSVR